MSEAGTPVTTPPKPDAADVPDGWNLIGSAGPFYKLVREDAVYVPRECDEDTGIARYPTVLVEPDGVLVTRGPGASRHERHAGPGNDAGDLAAALATVIDEWIAEGGDVYGGDELTARLDDTAAKY